MTTEGSDPRQTRAAHERWERDHLAPYACRAAAGRGRRHPEPAHDYRADYPRDRDRILHCKAFRRLEYKTQVFVNGTADHYRTRLTHTMEMAAVGRTLARALRANEDLTEAIALAHDIGHSPFGHAGEEALDELMKPHGGFDHNLQSCRAVEWLETPYPDFPGLNLTWEVRAGLRKRQAAIPGATLDGAPLGPFQFLEAQMADACDDLTYHAHDVDDGLEAGLVTDEKLGELEIWRLARERVARRHPRADRDRLLPTAVRQLLDLQVEDVINHSAAQLARFRPQSPADVMNAPERIVDFSPAMRRLVEPLHAFLFREVYFSPVVADANRESVRLMRALFLHYVAHPETMGRKARARMEEEGLWRTACDYVAGMTDRYALEETARFNIGQETP